MIKFEDKGNEVVIEYKVENLSYNLADSKHPDPYSLPSIVYNF